MSKGYQRNFADEQLRLTVLDCHSGKTVELLRPAKRNWVEDEWNTYWKESGDPNRHLEQEFSKIEASTLRRIRDVREGGLIAAERRAIVSLAAMHLVRSKSFVEFRSHIHRVAEPDLLSELSADPELLERFVAEKGRPPAEGELLEMVEKASSDLTTDRRWLTESLGEQYNKIAEILAESTIQILTLADHLPNLPLGDQPVVHADLTLSRFGFRDRLAVGDANLVLIPLTARRAACLAKERVPDTTVETRHQWKKLVDIQVRACVQEIAVHPGAASAVARLCKQPLKRPMRRTSAGIMI